MEGFWKIGVCCGEKRNRKRKRRESEEKEKNEKNERKREYVVVYVSMQ
jgi:hypothetical protein